MPDRAALLAQAEQGATMALQAIQALRAMDAQPVPQIAPAPAAMAHGLQNPKAFFDHMRGSTIMGPTLSESEVTGCGAILDACAAAGWPIAWTAYGLATAFHETAATMQPIKEYGGQAYYTKMYDITGARPTKARELGNTSPGDGAKYPGRGYVQLTGKGNYAKASAIVGVDLVADPDVAMKPDIAAHVMVSGMSLGWFSGKKLSDYLPDNGTADSQPFTQARRIVNGQDRAADIAAYAMTFQEALTEGSWT